MAVSQGSIASACPGPPPGGHRALGPEPPEATSRQAPGGCGSDGRLHHERPRGGPVSRSLQGWL